MLHNRKALTIALTLSLFTGCTQNMSTLRISGEDAVVNAFLLPVKESFEEENKGTRLDIVRSRSAGLLAQLKRGDVDAVISDHSIDELLNSAAAEQIRIDAAALQTVQLGESDTVVLLNLKNPLRKLDQRQLQDIFTGRISNWKQLHGPNQQIVPVLNVAPTADHDIFIREILGGTRITARVHHVYSYEEVRKAVTETPGAIGLAPSTYAAANVNVPQTPKAASTVIFVTSGAPSGNLNSLTDILKDAASLQ